MNKTFVTSLLTLVLITPLATGLTGCAMGSTTIAQEDSSTLAKKITKGKTTKEQVQAMFGEPTDKGTQGGREYWSYRTLQTSVQTYFGMGGTVSKDLIIYFDKAGVVSSYDTSQTKG